MRPFDGRRVLLGVTGGIASYKSAWLARLLTKAGAEVDVVLTRSAAEFIGATTFEGLTGRVPYTSLFGAGKALDHIRLARSADAIVIAPATADFLARAVHGQADDLLTACLLATRAPVLLVPAMNDYMWAHAQVQRNVARARELGYAVLDPEEGMLAAGEGSGPGRMPEPETIFAHLGRQLERDASLAGRKVVVTAGPTREPVDPVRFLSNRSSGKMGAAIAAAAWRRGADVVLVAGPMTEAAPVGVRMVPVETTAEMSSAVRSALPDADALLMAAAPADFRASEVASHKIKKASGPGSLTLSPTCDILIDTRDARAEGAVIVGFALETHDALEAGRRKLAAKQLDMVVVNDATEAGAAFGVDTNRVSIVHADGGDEHLELMLKSEVADAILDRVGARLRAR